MLSRLDRPGEPNLVSEVLDPRINTISSLHCINVRQDVFVAGRGPADRTNHQFFTIFACHLHQGRTTVRAVQLDEGTHRGHSARENSGSAKLLYERGNSLLNLGE